MEFTYRISEVIVKKTSVALVLILFAFSFPLHAAQEKGPACEAIPVFLEGMVSRIIGDGKTVPVVSDDRLRPSDRIRTGIKAKAALDLSGFGHLRLNELSEIQFDGIPAEGAPERRLRIRVFAGDAWVNAPGPAKGIGGLDVRMPFASIRAALSIFRLTILSDGSALVKVYSGPVEISKPEMEEKPKKKSAASENKRSWNHVVNSMQQIHVRSDGTATNPYPLMKKADETPWVEWNRKLDERLNER